MTTLPQQSLAAVTTAPNVMEMRQLDIPDIGDDEAIVHIEATGICGTDYEVVPRRPGYSISHHPGTRAPGTHCFDRVRRVRAVGRIHR